MAADKDIEKQIEELLAKMTLSEKIGQMVQINGFKGQIPDELKKKLLTQISNSGLEQSILSAYSHHTLEEIVDHFGLKKYFSHLAGLDHIYATSKVELGKDLINRIGVSGREVLLIGDTVHDFEVSREIGADCILVAGGHQNKKRLSECGVTVLDSLDEILSQK